MRLHIAVASVTSVAVMALGTGSAWACNPNEFVIGKTGGPTQTVPIQPGQVVPYSFTGVSPDATIEITVGDVPVEQVTDTSNDWGGHSGTFVVPKLATGDGAFNVTLTVHDNDLGEDGANAPETPLVRYTEPQAAEPATHAESQPVDTPSA